VPFLGLLGKAVHSVFDVVPNMLGVFLLLCFALPGVAMTLLLVATGRRGLAHAIAASVLLDAMPLLLFEWGHMALCAQFLPMLGLAMYVWNQLRPGDAGVALCWLGLLVLALLTHLYLFVMVGGIWAAALAQTGLDGRVGTRRLLGEAAAVVGCVVVLMLVTGMLSAETREGGTHGFGIFSLNLAAPFVPQMSGVIPPLRDYWIGMRTQVFGYPGLGALIVVLAGLPALPDWLRRRGRAHMALLAVLAVFYLFALSNRVMLGGRVLIDIPLPDGLDYALGAFRASGRFFTPVAYAAVAGGIVLVLSRYRARTALAILAVAGMLQLVDVGPVRHAIAESARHPPAPVFDRAVVGALVARASAVVMFPTTGCIDRAIAEGSGERIALSQATVELQLLAARRNLPVNAVVNSRIATDCDAEARARDATLRPGVAYFYLTPFTPSSLQLGGGVCAVDGALRMCMVDGG
jgi:hypothetical protein